MRPIFIVLSIQMTSLTVRLVDADNETDIERLLDIVDDEAAAEAMDEIDGMDEDDIAEWAEDSYDSFYDNDRTDWEIVFAVTPVDENNPQRTNKLEGFVNFYASKEVTKRAEREATRLGVTLIPHQHIIEVSMAKWPQAPRGQMTQGLLLACIEIDRLISDGDKQSTNIVAYIDPANEPSKKAFERAGFKNLGLVYYDLDDDLEDLSIDGVLMYEIDWSKVMTLLSSN